MHANVFLSAYGISRLVLYRGTSLIMRHLLYFAWSCKWLLPSPVDLGSWGGWLPWTRGCARQSACCQRGGVIAFNIGGRGSALSCFWARCALDVTWRLCCCANCFWQSKSPGARSSRSSTCSPASASRPHKHGFASAPPQPCLHSACKPTALHC